MVAEKLEMTTETTDESSGSVKSSSDFSKSTNGQHIPAHPVMIQYSPKRQRKPYVSGRLTTKLPGVRSPARNVTRSRKMSKSPTKCEVKKAQDIDSPRGSRIIMQPPCKNSTSHSTSRTRTTGTLGTTRTSGTLRTTRTSGTLGTTRLSTTSETSISSTPSKTKSCVSLQTPNLPTINVKMAGPIQPSSRASTTPSAVPRLPYFTRGTTASTKTRNTEPITAVKTFRTAKSLKKGTFTDRSGTSRSEDSEFWQPRVARKTIHPKTPTKVTTTPLRAEEKPSDLNDMGIVNESKSDGEKGTKKKGRKKTVTSTKSDTKKSETSTESKKSKKSKHSKSSKSGKGKKGKPVKEKVKKLNRKIVYKDLKAIEKKMEEDAKSRKKMEWEKQKLYFYWNSVVTRLLDLQRRNYWLKKKEASLKMEKRDGMFHQNWKTMNLARLQREECLDQKRAEFRSLIRELRDSHKRQTDWLFKDIQTYVKDTYLVGQKYVNDVVGIRMEYTKGLTETIFGARENLRVLEIEQNAKYGPVLEEFEEQMRKLRSKIPTERQDRLQKMLAESNGMLVELVNVYTTILHHNFIEVCHTANIINELKTVERRLERKMGDMVKKRDKIKERTEYLHDRISNLRRQVNSGKEARKKLHRVMKDQEALQDKIDLAYINKEITFQENSRLTKALQLMSERVDKWYFKVKRDFMKDIILDTANYEERVNQVKNYNYLIQYLFNVENDFLETLDTFKDHEEFDDPSEGLKVLLGVYRPYTVYDLEREFEGCTESFNTAIIFFKRRLQQHYMSLDDLHFFIRRRNPLSYLNRTRREEMELKKVMAFVLGSRYGQSRPHSPGATDMTAQSSKSLKL